MFYSRHCRESFRKAVLFDLGFGIRRVMHVGFPEKFLKGRDHVLLIAYSLSDSLLYPQLSPHCLA